MKYRPGTWQMYMGESCVSGLESEIPSHFDRISSLWQNCEGRNKNCDQAPSLGLSSALCHGCIRSVRSACLLPQRCHTEQIGLKEPAENCAEQTEHGTRSNMYLMLQSSPHRKCGNYGHVFLFFIAQLAGNIHT